MVPVSSRFLVWICFVGILISSLSLGPTGQRCDGNDLNALKEFAGNLRSRSLISDWLDDSLCCKWTGVVCYDERNESKSRRVVELLLPNRLLIGSISKSLGQLDELKVLNLSSNHLAGELPAAISNLQKLKVLDISWNFLKGSISESLSGLKSVEYLDLSSNLFGGNLFDLRFFPSLVSLNVSNNTLNGGLNADLCSSSGIQTIDLSMNNFQGKFSGLTNCRFSLRELHLDYNSFSGELPESLYEISSMEKLSISGNTFSGQLSMNLSKLWNLQALIISTNSFSGRIPDIFTNLTHLQILIAKSNSFSGNLPSSLSSCSNLHVLDLRNNSLTGTIDLKLSSLSRLTTLDLASNQLTGSILDSLSNHRSLRTINLSKNNFTGELLVSNLTSLSVLSISNNSFTDLSKTLSTLQSCSNLTTLILTKNFKDEEMPELSISISNLKILAVGNCGLRGYIPNWLSNCRKLEVLDLSWNQLRGSIPLWLGYMKSLSYLDISNNSLSGEIPATLFELKSLISREEDEDLSTTIPLFVKRNISNNGLQYKQPSSFPPAIYLSCNNINSEINPRIARLKELHILDLSRNQIHGSIPSSIGEMKNLEILDFSWNNISGSIPESLTKLTFLSKFSVAHNRLKGEIPSGGQFLSFGNSSFDGNEALCGLNYPPCRLNYYHQIIAKSNLRRTGLVLGVIIGVFSLVVVLIFLVRRKREKNGSEMEEEEEGFSDESDLVDLNLNLTLAEILTATSNFDQANIIGCGGFGLVYKAYLPNGAIAAVKKLSGDGGQADREFQAEVESLSRAQHKNLVSLRGYCRYGGDRLLIYSYMENGSLDYWLHEVDTCARLPWRSRLRIARGAARGLAYLHNTCDPSIVHRDVKSSNILLDEKFEAHLADFGLSRLLRPYDTHVTTDLVGTLGYIPPEYAQSLTATFKGDVYSFGVVLLELVTGRRPVEVGKGKSCRDLVSRVLQLMGERRGKEIIDRSVLGGEFDDEVLEVLSVACKCVLSDPHRRPAIDLVVSWLDLAGKDEPSGELVVL